MNKLLRFFLPKVFVETFKAFGLFFGVCLILKFAPINKSIFEMVSFVSFFGFPIFTYFSKKVYLSASMEWILLTPVKKRDIILANALLNTIKATLIVVLLLLMYHVLFGINLSLGELLTLVLQAPAFFKSEVNLPTSTYVFSSFLGLLVFAFLAGILPNYAQNIQQRQNHHVPTTLAEKIKNPKKLLAMLSAGLMLILFFMEGSSVSVPAFIGYGIFLAGFLALVVFSTLHTVKYYYPKKPLIIFFVILSFLVIQLLHVSFENDIRNSKLSFDHRLEGLENLASFHDDVGSYVFSDLESAPKKSQSLVASDFYALKASGRFELQFRNLRTEWSKLCEVRKDHSCRLASYFMATEPKSTQIVDILRKGCENDLRSCFEILKYYQPANDEKLVLEAKMRTQCVTKEYVKKSFCEGFRGTLKKTTEKALAPSQAP